MPDLAVVEVIVPREPAVVEVLVPGTPGRGVPLGGDTGAILTKLSPTHYDTAWSTPRGLNQTLGIYDTSPELDGAEIDASIEVVRTLGYYVPGDGGGHDWVVSATEPVHSLKRQSADGRWWEPSIAGYADLRWFGCRGPHTFMGDTLTPVRFHAEAQACIDYANLYQIPIHLTGLWRSTVGVPRLWCGAPLRIYDNTVIIGLGYFPTFEFYFPDDTDGFVMNDSSVQGLTANWILRGFRVVGSAPESNSATVTVGLRARIVRDNAIDLQIQDFVDGMEFDAAETGLISQRGYVHVIQSKYPNPTNGFPRYGIRVTAIPLEPATGSPLRQPQLFNLGVKVYSALSAIPLDGPLPADKSVTMDMAVYNSSAVKIGTKGPLWAHDGIHVYKYDAAAQSYTKSTDYDLYDVSSGTDVLIPDLTGGEPTTNIVAAGAFNAATMTQKKGINRTDVVKIVCGPSWAEGDIYRILLSDSWGLCAIKVERGSGLKFEGDVGGYAWGVETNGPNNKFDFNYCQLLKYGIYSLGSDAHGTICFPPRQMSRRTINGPMLTWEGKSEGASSPKGIITIDSEFTARNSFNTQTITNLSTVGENNFVPLAGPGGGYIEVVGHRPTWREIVTDLIVTISVNAAIVDYEVAIERSTNNRQNWSVLMSRRYSVPIGVTRSHARLEWLDTAFLDQVGGVLDAYSYRVGIRAINTNNSVTVSSSGTQNSFLRVKEINPSSSVSDRTPDDAEI